MCQAITDRVTATARAVNPFHRRYQTHYLVNYLNILRLLGRQSFSKVGSYATVLRVDTFQINHFLKTGFSFR